MADTDPVLLNVAGVSQLVNSRLNKVPQNAEDSEGETGERIDVLELSMSDEELLELRDKWVSRYASYEAKLKTRQEANKTYYAGTQNQGTGFASDYPIASNVQWEAAETFYAAALSKNPDPVVYADDTPEGNQLADDTKTMLQYHADYLDLRGLLLLQTRQWSIYLLGVKKWGWDKDTNEVCCDVRKIQDFIFDPNGYVDVHAHYHGPLGERITRPATDVIDDFPKHKDYISLSVDHKLGTEITYTEWWTDEMCFTTYKEKVLDKHKNEYFKYGEDTTDEFGFPVTIPGNNHFASPRKPYTFLTVYSLGEQPHDITNNMEQNIPNQNLITKRTMQIDVNLSRQNNSEAFSENNFNQETAKQAATAFQKGNPVLVPSGGPISEAIARFPAEGFPDAAFKELEQNKEALMSSWGVTGIMAQKPDEDTTARGMILNQQFDNTRIGGGVGSAIERVAKADFNWLVQLYHVYYDEPHFAAIMGQMKAVEYVTLSSAQLTHKLIVSVAPDSMKPKDEVTMMNQALTLWEQGALDPQTLLTILNVPNPKETAAQVVLWRLAPQQYMQANFPDIMQLIQSLNPMAAMQQAGAQQGAPPTEGGAAVVPGAPMGGASTPLQPPPTTGGVPASAALSQVPLPA
jgi:hypothetical protein